MCLDLNVQSSIFIVLIFAFFLFFVCLFLAALGLHCWAQAFSSGSKRGLLFPCDASCFSC